MFFANLLPDAWRQTATVSRDVAPCLPGPFPNPSADVCREVAKPTRKMSGSGLLILSLMSAGRAVSITELAGLMGCSVGEASKRVKAAGKSVRVKRVGRCKLVRLPSMSLAEWKRLAEASK